MKTPITLTSLLALFAGGFLAADTFTLKDGSKLEGEIIAEQGDSYTLSVQVTASIKDERTIPKDEIVKIDRVSRSDQAFEGISGLLPTADRLAVEQYDQMINRQVKPFLDAFPRTKHTKKVEEILATLEKEREMAANGGLKLQGEWIKPEDRKANAYEIDALVLYSDAEEAAEAGRFQAALKLFERIEAEYKAAAIFPKAVELAQRVMAAYRSKVEADLKRVDTLIKNRSTEMERLPRNQRETALAEIKRLENLYLELVKEEKASRTRWLTLDPYQKGPMTETIRAIDSETRRLETMDLAAIKPAGPTYRQAWAAVSKGKVADAKKLFTELRTLRVPDHYIAAMEEELPEKEVMDEPVTPPTPDPAEEAAAKKAAEEAAAAAAAEEAEKQAAEEAAAAKAAAAQVVNEAPVEEESGGLNMVTILIVVMALVLLVAVGAVFAGSRKKKLQD